MRGIQASLIDGPGYWLTWGKDVGGEKKKSTTPSSVGQSLREKEKDGQRGNPLS